MMRKKPCSSVMVVFIFVVFLSVTDAFAFSIEKIKVFFLSGDFKAAIQEGEKVMATAQQSPDLDELYYYLGLSYLKDGNYLRASDIFEIIIDEFKKSRFVSEAKLGLADTYFLLGNYAKAEAYYKEILREGPSNKLISLVYYRLSELSFKKGDSQAGKDYLQMLKVQYPLNQEVLLDNNLLNYACPQETVYYSVQVGCFSSRANAENLNSRLRTRKYDSFIEESVGGAKRMYRVKVGRFVTRQQAVRLDSELSQDGYPTKITP